MMIPLLLGGACGLVAWSPGNSPAVGSAFPLLWAMSGSRRAASVLAAAYAMASVRFLPPFAAKWFGSQAMGLTCWVGVGIASGALWGLLWPRRHALVPVFLATLAALTLSLAPPVGALFPGHPVVCWGYGWPGAGWAGIAAMAVGTAAAAAALRHAIHCPGRAACAWFALAAAGISLAGLGVVPDPASGERVGNVVGVSTSWGGFPAYGSIEVADRLQRIGATLDAPRVQQSRIVVFPEGIIGLYDASLDDVIEMEILRRIRRTGQTVVLGANVDGGGGRFGNVALVLRPDGTRPLLAARQATPVSQWRPWSSRMHFPADWLAGGTVHLGGQVKARIMFCHEEWMPALHLLTEAREDHEMIIAMANLWAAKDPLAAHVQAAHTQGMALLFRRPFVRAVNAQRQAQFHEPTMQGERPTR